MDYKNDSDKKELKQKFTVLRNNCERETARRN